MHAHAHAHEHTHTHMHVQIKAVNTVADPAATTYTVYYPEDAESEEGVQARFVRKLSEVNTADAAAEDEAGSRRVKVERVCRYKFGACAACHVWR